MEVRKGLVGVRVPAHLVLMCFECSPDHRDQSGLICTLAFRNRLPCYQGRVGGCQRNFIALRMR